MIHTNLVFTSDWCTEIGIFIYLSVTKEIIKNSLVLCPSQTRVESI